jgi:hypothetical protein
LVGGLEKIIEFKSEIENPQKAVIEMIELTKKLAMLILNRVITFKYWPEEDLTWSEWRYEVILRSIDFQGDPCGN